jgi:hypothetical protein
VLFGNCKPTGKLPRAWPLENEQLSASANGMDNPLFPRGFGLTYELPPAKRASTGASGAKAPAFASGIADGRE